MLVIRSIAASDLDPLIEMAREVGGGMTTLKPDRQMLGDRVACAVASFQETIPPEERDYMFVLDDTETGRMAGVCAIKAAVDHYTSSQARILAARGIRVNAVAPGSIEFPGGSWERRKTDDPALYNSVLAEIPFGRLGRPEEVAELVLFLASRRASWITGQSIVVNGGQLLGT